MTGDEKPDGGSLALGDSVRLVSIEQTREGLSDDKVDELVKRFDSNGDGVLDLDEFTNAWADPKTRAALV